jgi:tRNA(His) 5'-end guanylyltransferase
VNREALAERINPYEVLPAHQLEAGRPIVARLVGRRFDPLYDTAKLEKPFDTRFGKMMLKTLSHLCATLGAHYGYCERSEMSLFAVSNGGEARRLVSRIGGEAAGKLSLLLGDVVTFETRLYEFPSPEEARAYFRWRREESQSNALDVYCNHVLIVNGADPQAVPMILEGLDNDEKVELLRQNSLDYAQVPSWQRLGAGVYVSHDNGSTGRLTVDLNLPDVDIYPDYLERFVV